MLPLASNAKMNIIDMLSDENYIWHGAKRHLHEFTGIFGAPEVRLGARTNNSIKRQFVINESKPLDGCIKVTAQWAQDGQTSFPVRFTVNGKTIWSGSLHLPIVCSGWPSVYISVPPAILKNGCNEIELDIDGPELLMNQFTLFFRSPAGSAMEVLHKPRVLTTNAQFSITLLAFEPLGDIKVDCTGPIELITNSDTNKLGEQDYFFRTSDKAGACSVVFISGSNRVEVALPIILDVPAGLPCYVGSDSDDHPHDETGVMNEILLHLFRSEIGNMVMFRPKIGRNCEGSPLEKSCRQWIDTCHRFAAKYLVCDWPIFGTFPENMYPEMAKDPNFVGYHVHEPYFVMHNDYSGEDFKLANDFATARDAYLNDMTKLVESYHARGAKVAAGEASWFSGYDGQAGFDIINIEAITGVGPVLGCARGTLRGRPHMSFGHHIAIEWYLGYPYDDLKSHRFWLMMLLTYTHGGSYIYAENSLFFTNSYQRHDPEDGFTSNNRALMSKFYDISRLQPRTGEPVAELAAAYGNLESILWHHDDVLPETEDGSTWMNVAWNKWEIHHYRPAWRALDAWLAPVEIEKYNGNKSILKWFSGNPYGNVDIVSVDRPLEVLQMYKVFAFLGWNTMTDEILAKIKEYVSGGGILFIGACQFDTRVSFDGDYTIDTTGAENLLGLSVIGRGQLLGSVSWNDITYGPSDESILASLDIRSAEVLVSDSNDNPILLCHSYGSGRVYFYNFWNHPTADTSVELMKEFMRELGEHNKSSFGVEDGYGIDCSHWYDADTGVRRMYLVNVNWQKPRKSRVCKLRLWDKIFPVNVNEHGFTVITVKDNVALIMDNPLICVKEMHSDGSECRIVITGNSNYTLRLICADSSIAAKPMFVPEYEAMIGTCVVSGSVAGDVELVFKLTVTEYPWPDYESLAEDDNVRALSFII